MARDKNKINAKIMLTIDTSNTYNIPIIITNHICEILYMTNISKPPYITSYILRHNVLNQIDDLIQTYNVDTILFEKNKLFLDKIDKYPDTYVLRDVILGFGVQVAIEDKYYEKLTLISLPEYDWKNSILGNRARYAIDLYKSHILNRTDIPIKYLVNIENNNYYKAICLSESILFDNLMDKKYQINKGDLKN